MKWTICRSSMYIQVVYLVGIVHHDRELYNNKVLMVAWINTSILKWALTFLEGEKPEGRQEDVSTMVNIKESKMISWCGYALSYWIEYIIWYSFEFYSFFLFYFYFICVEIEIRSKKKKFFFSVNFQQGARKIPHGWTRISGPSTN